MFNAFRSDDEDVDTKAKSKPITKPKTSSTNKTIRNNTRTSKPKPVSKPTGNNKPAFKKREVVEPSQVDDKRRSFNRRGRGIKPGDTDSRGKRFFDRKSGSGRGRGGKKGGAGKSNWGKAGEYNTNFSISGDGAQPPVDGEQPVEKPEKKEEEEDEVPPEPEKETFTLQEFMKKKAEKRVGKAFEDLTLAEVDEVKDGKAYTKKDKADSEAQDILFQFKESVKKTKAKKNDRTKKAVEGISFNVRNQDRERRGFGRGRGRGGGFRGRGGYKKRSDRQGQGSKRVNVDTNDFPQLGA